MCAFEFNDEYKITISHKKIEVFMIFDVKIMGDTLQTRQKSQYTLVLSQGRVCA